MLLNHLFLAYNRNKKNTKNKNTFNSFKQFTNPDFKETSGLEKKLIFEFKV